MLMMRTVSLILASCVITSTLGFLIVDPAITTTNNHQRFPPKSHSKPIHNHRHEQHSSHRQLWSNIISSSTPTSSPPTDIRRYTHDGWNLTYRYQPPPSSPSSFLKSNNNPALLLIHPVGIGLHSWFWDNTLSTLSSSPNSNIGPIYAPDLIGCNPTNSLWDPSIRGLFFPLSWVQSIETLLTTVIRRPTIIVVQGGLAPVGVMLAARDNNSLVKGLVMTSPPTWRDMTRGIPEWELRLNYEVLRSELIGGWAFDVLEKRWAVKFFSDLFLFDKTSSSSDDEWLNRVAEGCGDKGVRQPVMAFNAGLCNHRSFEEELRSIKQPTLILSGSGDARRRGEYEEEMRDCRLVTLKEGKNVLPWENSVEVCRILEEFCGGVV